MSFMRSEADREAARRKQQQQKEFLQAQMVDIEKSRQKENRKANEELIRERAVSYTHLTLPTKA